MQQRINSKRVGVEPSHRDHKMVAVKRHFNPLGHAALCVLKCVYIGFILFYFFTYNFHLFLANSCNLKMRTCFEHVLQKNRNNRKHFDSAHF